MVDQKNGFAYVLCKTVIFMLNAQPMVLQAIQSKPAYIQQQRI